MKGVGVDIGATSVRVVEVDGIDQGFAKVSKLAVVPLPSGAMVHGVIAEPAVVAAALDQAIDRIKVNRRGIVLGVGSADCALTSRVLPSGLKPQEREMALRNDPTPMSSRVRNDQLDISDYVAGRLESADGATKDDVVVAVARRENVEAFSQVCELCKIQPKALDLSAAALVRALVRVPDVDNVAHAIVDVGASKTTVAIRRGLNLRGVRTSEGGGNDITRAVVSASGDEWADAERRKRNLRVGNAVEEAAFSFTGYGQKEALGEAEAQSSVEDAFTTAVESIVDQIAISIEGLRREGDFPAAITLAGGSGQIRGLNERLYQRLGIPVALGRPWAELAQTRENEPHLARTEAAGPLLLSLAPAIGLALWSPPAEPKGGKNK